MTEAPVPLAEQPTDEEIGRSIAGLIGVRLNYEAQGAPPEALKLIDLARKVCCDYARIKQSLQRRERAMAVVEAAREWAIDIRDNNRWLDDPRAIRVYNAVVGFAGLAAFDAANTAGDAVTTEEAKQNHGDKDRC